MDASFAEAVQHAGEHLVCREGCTQCCHGAFVLSPLDTLRLQTGMGILRATDAALATEIDRRAHAWIAEHAEEFPGDAATGQLGESKIDKERFENFANDAACPALDPTTGRCDVYQWRPMTCRVFGPPVRMGEGEEIGHCELCFTNASPAEVVDCEMTVPFELENELIEEIPLKNETVVGYALIG